MFWACLFTLWWGWKHMWPLYNYYFPTSALAVYSKYKIPFLPQSGPLYLSNPSLAVPPVCKIYSYILFPKLTMLLSACDFAHAVSSSWDVILYLPCLPCLLTQQDPSWVYSVKRSWSITIFHFHLNTKAASHTLFCAIFVTFIHHTALKITISHLCISNAQQTAA